MNNLAELLSVYFTAFRARQARALKPRESKLRPPFIDKPFAGHSRSRKSAKVGGVAGHVARGNRVNIGGGIFRIRGKLNFLPVINVRFCDAARGAKAGSMWDGKPVHKQPVAL